MVWLKLNHVRKRAPADRVMTKFRPVLVLSPAGVLINSLTPERCGNDSKSAISEHTLRWRHYWRVNVSNHQPCDCLFNRSFTRRSKKTSKLRVTGLCAGNSPVTGEFPAQMASNAENVSIWWRHHDLLIMFMGTSCKIALRWTPQTTFNHKSTWSGNGIVPSGNKPVPEPMLTQIYVSI